MEVNRRVYGGTELTQVRAIWDNNNVRGRAGSTGAFREGLQAEVSSYSLNRWQPLTGEREFALTA